MWTGCTPLEVPKDMVDNGAIFYFYLLGIYQGDVFTKSDANQLGSAAD